MINADKPQKWKEDTQASVDQFNEWFMKFAPQAFREARVKTTAEVENSLLLTNDLRAIDAASLATHPQILPTLRMACCPPLARDRLVGLARTTKFLVRRMEEGKLSPRMASALLQEHLGRISGIIAKMLDRDIFPWLAAGSKPTKAERHRASTIVADRLCGAVSDPIVRNAQEQRQLELIGKFLQAKGYRQKQHLSAAHITEMEPGTYSLRLNIRVGQDPNEVNIPVDVVIQPRRPRRTRLPILIEAKSAGDFTNVNKRRKEEATKMIQLRATYGDSVQYVLFLCGYFDGGYLGYEAQEGMDWIWEHRLDDLNQLGL
jgi:XamI restriction endonuclease